jgi:hypothetical protein
VSDLINAEGRFSCKFSALDKLPRWKPPRKAREPAVAPLLRVFQAPAATAEVGGATIVLILLQLLEVDLINAMPLQRTTTIPGAVVGPCALCITACSHHSALAVRIPDVVVCAACVQA